MVVKGVKVYTLRLVSNPDHSLRRYPPSPLYFTSNVCQECVNFFTYVFSRDMMPAVYRSRFLRDKNGHFSWEMVAKAMVVERENQKAPALQYFG